jgi:Type IV conjugative transfer system lipoprotein (TraV)
MRRKHMIQVVLLVGGCLLGTACARVKALEGPPQGLQALYQEAVGTPPPAPAVQAKDLPVGPEAPYTPILQPPQVQRVWVPDHLNADGDLVAGHWVYLLLEPARWFIETYPASPTPTLRVPLAPPVPPAAPSPPAASASPGHAPGTAPGSPRVSLAPPAVPGPGAMSAPRGGTPAQPPAARRKGTP